MKKSLMTPLLYAAIMFLLIRLANDLPSEAHYISHSWQFIATELVGVIAGSIVCYHLACKWMALTIRRNIGMISILRNCAQTSHSTAPSPTPLL